MVLALDADAVESAGVEGALGAQDASAEGTQARGDQPQRFSTAQLNEFLSA